MSGLTLDHLTIRRDQLAGHHPQTSEALREDIRLHVSVVVLARPDESSGGLDGLRDHVVDQTMFVVDPGFFEFGLVLAVWLGKGTLSKGRRRERGEGEGRKYVRFVDLLEDVLEAAVVLLEDGVLRRHKLKASTLST